MNAKPSDIFLNVIEFFGILVPGGLLCFLHKEILSDETGIPFANLDSTTDWISAIVFSYIIGSMVFGISVLLNKLVKIDNDTVKYYEEVAKGIKLPIKNNIEDVFYTVFSYIRLNSPSATGELERQTAEYKLFRSLILVILIDLIIMFATKSMTVRRFVIDFVLIGISFYRFRFLVRWTYRLAFDYYLLMTKKHSNYKEEKRNTEANNPE